LLGKIVYPKKMSVVSISAETNNNVPKWIFRMRQKIFSRENITAVILCFILVAVIVFTTDQSPQWIYQGF